MYSFAEKRKKGKGPKGVFQGKALVFLRETGRVPRDRRKNTHENITISGGETTHRH